MISIVLEVEGLDEVRKLLKGEPQNQAEAMIKAQNKVASLAVKHLKRGLDMFGGKYPSKGHPNPNYKNSKKGEMPLKHSGRLQSSIFFKNLAHKTSVETKLGAILNPPDYAKYLEGRKGDGIRPFLWFAKDIFNVKNVLNYFDKYYRPLQGIK